MTAATTRRACSVATGVVLVGAFTFTATADPQGRDATYFVVLLGLLGVTLVPVVLYGVSSRGRLTTPICGTLMFVGTAASRVPVVVTRESLAFFYPTVAFACTVGISLFAVLYDA